jgi:DNA-binding winged helix-turn-helix (wHTH) protein
VFVRFGEFTFDRDAKSLLKEGRLVHLTPRAFKLLTILLENRPRPVEKLELERQLWPDGRVADNNLPNVVLEVRRALNDERRLGLIRTLHGVGYAFLGEALNAAAPATTVGTFRVWVGGSQIGLELGENWIGRALECRVQVDCSLVSRRHACIVVDESNATLKDGDSRNGTFLNDKRLARPTRLHHRDQIRVGTVHLGFRIVRPDDPTDAELDG